MLLCRTKKTETDHALGNELFVCVGRFYMYDVRVI